MVSIMAIAFFFKTHGKIMKSKFSRVSKSDFYKFSMLIWISSLSVTITSNVDTILLAFLKAPEIAGYYQAALPTAQFLIFFITPIVTVILPFITKLWTKKNIETLNNTVSSVVKFLLIFMAPAVIILEFFSPQIMTLIFGDKFIPAINPFRILIIGMTLYSLVSLMLSVANGISKPKYHAIIMTSVGIVSLGLNLILIQLFGAVGAAISFTIASITGLLIAVMLLKRHIKFRILKSDLGKIVIGGAITSVPIFFGRIMFKNILAEAIIILFSILIYFIFIMATKAINKNDIKLIKDTKLIPRKYISIIEKVIIKMRLYN